LRLLKGLIHCWDRVIQFSYHSHHEIEAINLL
jgi:hypothetical protein